MSEYIRIPGSARRYRNVDTGEEISRREYIKRTEKVTPEQKAYLRVKEGKAKPGITSRKYEQTRKRKAIEKLQKGQIDYGFEGVDRELESRQMPSKGDYRVSQLAGSYYCRNSKTGRVSISNGFSTAIDSSKKPVFNSIEFQILRKQATEHALAKFEGDYNWAVIGVYEEVWVDW
jgi:hypothetical protein